jgi:hypothetical protein
LGHAPLIIITTNAETAIYVASRNSELVFFDEVVRRRRFRVVGAVPRGISPWCEYHRPGSG